MKNENGESLANTNSILNSWKDYFSQLRNVGKDNTVVQIEIQTSEPLIPEPTLLEIAIAKEKLKKYKSPDIDKIPPDLTQDFGNPLHTEIYKLVQWGNKVSWRNHKILDVDLCQFCPNRSVKRMTTSLPSL